MGRLIDADVLMERLANYKVNNGRHCSICIDAIKTIISNQPTAYDLEDVTDKLSDLSSADADYTLAEDLVDRKAVITIVRNGGK